MVETENIVCNDWNLNFQIIQNHLNFLLGPSVKTTLTILVASCG